MLTELDEILKSLAPETDSQQYVFCQVPGDVTAYLEWAPVAIIQEREGSTLILTESAAREAGLEYADTFHRITLMVHSSLQAVGLTAAVSGRLAQAGIAANMVAGYCHDHIFVPAERAEEALGLLSGF
ncbi:ACT domain-containing protein [Pseudohongiella spirulinae]|uniref:Transporter n=1 Tax=Pseudohongiella spirulinae TaxID=1249552 RepID=A0A0S2KCH1_9GAMM|nr:ACT domain-containing protein [Pseudohongiella spirulinae]ALO45811.1 transporter [Pseudohongiella spirulinae]